jgi:hypothetical protein
MFTVGLCGLALIQWEKLAFLESAIQRGGFGYLWTTLEIVIFGGLVWALVSSRANARKEQADRFTQRLRARQKELTLK